MYVNIKRKNKRKNYKIIKCKNYKIIIFYFFGLISTISIFCDAFNLLEMGLQS